MVFLDNRSQESNERKCDEEIIIIDLFILSIQKIFTCFSFTFFLFPACKIINKAFFGSTFDIMLSGPFYDAFLKYGTGYDVLVSRTDKFEDTKYRHHLLKVGVGHTLLQL